jgi:hypothetical protein
MKQVVRDLQQKVLDAGKPKSDPVTGQIMQHQGIWNGYWWDPDLAAITGPGEEYLMPDQNGIYAIAHVDKLGVVEELVANLLCVNEWTTSQWKRISRTMERRKT